MLLEEPGKAEKSEGSGADPGPKNPFKDSLRFSSSSAVI